VCLFERSGDTSRLKGCRQEIHSAARRQSLPGAAAEHRRVRRIWWIQPPAPSLKSVYSQIELVKLDRHGLERAECRPSPLLEPAQRPLLERFG
jgi:hypothetical protein